MNFECIDRKITHSSSYFTIEIDWLIFKTNSHILHSIEWISYANDFSSNSLEKETQKKQWHSTRSTLLLSIVSDTSTVIIFRAWYYRRMNILFMRLSASYTSKAHHTHSNNKSLEITTRNEHPFENGLINSMFSIDSNNEYWEIIEDDKPRKKKHESSICWQMSRQRIECSFVHEFSQNFRWNQTFEKLYLNWFM
jgi:hypothetical protein